MILPKLNRRTFLASAAAAAAFPFSRFSFARTGAREFDLVAQNATKTLYAPDGESSQVWAYNGVVPGPEIRAQKGDRIKVNFRNELEEPTSIHWHGIRIENLMDGVAGLTQEAVEPGDNFVYEFDLPDAGTYWYHAHNRSWNQVGRGLYGTLIIDEPERPFDSSHDITVLIDDWRLREPGVLETQSFGSLMDWSHGGRLGNWITVNGESLPTMSLRRGEAYRLRLINASNARVLELDPNRFGGQVLAYDGQALPQPFTIPYAPALLGPAQRMDLLVIPENDFALEEVSRGEGLPLIAFAVDGYAKPSSDIPNILVNDIPEPDLNNAKRIKVLMQGGAMGGTVQITYEGKVLDGEDFRRTGQVWAFNGVANLADEPLFRAEKGETIIIETTNETTWLHAMHLHGHHFRIINRSGSDINEGKPWRDTFMIGPEQTNEIAFVADNPGKWLYHCHMLEHAAAGMNTWFEIS